MTGQRQSQNQNQRQDQKQKQRQYQLQTRITEAAIRDQDCKSALEADRELFEPEVSISDIDDSAPISIATSDGYFDQSWQTDLPLLMALKRKLHPAVLFAISQTWLTHESGSLSMLKVKLFARQSDTFEQQNSMPLTPRQLRQMVTNAIALHLKREMTAIGMQANGDWAHIPALKDVPDNQQEANKYRRLGILVEEIHGKNASTQLLKKLQHARGLLEFAIRLPNDDVITPLALIDPARISKRASRAGVLRLLTQSKTKPFSVAGETWSQEDWRGFEKAQSNAQSPKAPKSNSKKSDKPKTF